MERIVSLDNLYLAYQKACRGKQCKQEVRRFSEHFDANIQELRLGIIDGTVAVGDYHYFTIHDPKTRTICAASFRERILHHAILNVCHEYFDKTLIDTTYATRLGKGVYAAIDQAVDALSHYEYSVKLDFRKYYDSIDHQVLKNKLRQRFKDPALLLLFDRIIDSYCVKEGKGLPIGNLSSQYFANFYLSGLDHFVKEDLKTPCYIRYMDDILLAGNDKVDLKRIVWEMSGMATDNLHLAFKPPVFRKSKDGQVFLGYKVMPYRYELAGRSKRRFRTKLLAYEKLLETGRWGQEQYAEHILPLLAFVEHAESRKFREASMKIQNGDNRRAGLTA